MNIISCVGGHPIRVYKNATYDARIRKYTGGVLVTEIPFSGKMLSAKVEQVPADPIVLEGVSIPTMSRPKFVGVDEPPVLKADEYIVVSAMYLAAAKELGYDTSHMLTIGGTVIDDDGRVIGACSFNRN